MESNLVSTQENRTLTAELVKSISELFKILTLNNYLFSYQFKFENLFFSLQCFFGFNQKSQACKFGDHAGHVTSPSWELGVP